MSRSFRISVIIRVDVAACLFGLAALLKVLM
jgi:hypothetical protein